MNAEPIENPSWMADVTSKGKSNPRRSNGAKRTALRKRVKSLGLPCALCGEAIDYSLPQNHPMSYELDEIVPVSKGGDPFDINNVQPTHRRCNQIKGDGTKPFEMRFDDFPTSREW